MRLCPTYLLTFLYLLAAGSGNISQAQTLTQVEIDTGQDLYAVTFTDALHGWVSGDNGTIFKTTDGGLNWVSVQTQYSESLFAASFFDHQSGWLAGEGEAVLFTNNGGRNWSDFRPGSTGARDIYSFFSLDINRIFTAGSPGRWIYTSDNSGLTWERSAVLPVSADCTIRSLHFTDPSTGFFTACGSVWSSRDGGKTWIQLNPETTTDAGILHIAMINSQYGYILSESGSSTRIQRVEIHNQTITFSRTSDPGQYTSLSVLDEHKAWAAARGGKLYQTADGGESWTPLDTGTNEDLTDISVLESGRLWVVGKGGTLLRLDFPASRSVMEPSPPYTTLIDSETEVLEMLNRVLRYGEFTLQLNNPLQRTRLYRRMISVLKGIRNFYEDQRMPVAVSDRLTDIPAVYFAEENNRGVELYNGYLEQGQSISDSTLITAIHHFSNAATLLPDSSTSWSNLAYAQQQSGNPAAALEAAIKAFERTEDVDSNLYDLLIRLFLLNERTEEAYQMAVDANARFPDEAIFLEYLADMDRAKTDVAPSEATESLDRLIQSFPDEPRYRFARATRFAERAEALFRRAAALHEEIWNLDLQRLATNDSEEQDRLRSEMERLETEKEQSLDEANRLFELSGNDLEAAIDSEPSDAKNHALLGNIYLLKASFLDEIRLLTVEEEEAMNLEAMILDCMQNAFGHYSRALQAEPGNELYRSELEQIERFLNQ
jgi:photosystem II stability/assembly factor-like uncharacterized protein